MPEGLAHARRAERPLLKGSGMKTLRLHVVRDAHTTTLFFTRFPVRIGRDPACPCQLSEGFVSRSHAMLDLCGGRLVLRDEGSVHGTLVGGGRVRLARGQVVDLAHYGYDFHIGSILVRAEVREERIEGRRDEQGGQEHTLDLANATRLYEDSDVNPAALDRGAIVLSLSEALEQYRRARAALCELLRQIKSDPAKSEHVARHTLEAHDIDATLPLPPRPAARPVPPPLPPPLPARAKAPRRVRDEEEDPTVERLLANLVRGADPRDSQAREPPSPTGDDVGAEEQTVLLT